MNPHEQFDELAAGYVLDALSADDRRRFDEHLASCASCQATLVELRRVSAGLGMTTDPVHVPASLRARTLARATAEPQVAGQKPVAARGPSTDRSPRSWLAMAAALFCIAGLGLYVMSLRSQLDSTREMLAEATARVEAMRRDLAGLRADAVRLTNTLNVLRSDSVVRVDLKGPEAGRPAAARAYLGANRSLAFSAERLPVLPADRSYQLWVVPPGPGMAPVSAAVFSVDQAGNSLLYMDLPDGVSSVVAVAVTEEPRGGSVKATTAAVLIGTVSLN